MGLGVGLIIPYSPPHVPCDGVRKYVREQGTHLFASITNGLFKNHS